MDSIIWGAITTLGAGALALLGKRHMRRAALVEQTPTTPAASLVAAVIVEIKGRVVAAESTLVAPIAGREAVWTNVSIQSEDRGPLERVLSLLATRGIKDFAMEKLRWTERALFVGDPVYVLGHAKLGPAPPTSDGYRS